MLFFRTETSSRWLCPLDRGIIINIELYKYNVRDIQTHQLEALPNKATMLLLGLRSAESRHFNLADCLFITKLQLTTNGVLTKYLKFDLFENVLS